jgi:hypothetical protein
MNALFASVYAARSLGGSDCPALQSLVGSGVLGMSSQMVTKLQVSEQGAARDRADVEIVRGQMSGQLECVAVRNTALLGETVAEGGNPSGDVWEVGFIPDDNVDIEARPRRETGNCGAADVLDAERNGAERTQKGPAQFLELERPPWIVVDNDNRF